MPTPVVANLLASELRELASYAPHPGNYAIRLDANEAPRLLTDAARRRLAEAALATPWERYPDASSEALRAALAARTGVTPEEVLVGVGSDEIIALLLTALSRPRTGAGAPVVLTTTPTFVMYAMSARVRGQRVLEVPLDADWDLAPQSLAAALKITEPNLIFVASPNNPTANKMSLDRLVGLIESAPRSLVVVDEAYIDYSDHDQLELYRRYENVAILRTLSKIGFAALRVGWLVARAELIREIDKVRLPYNMPSLSQTLGALAVTELAPEITRITTTVIAERERLAAELRELPRLRVLPSQANFLWLQSERQAGELFEGLKERGILVRSFHQRGGRLNHQLRVTIGTRDENQALLEGLAALV